MSYEGYEQYLCSNGHYWEADALEYEPPVCPECGENHVWWNSVDQTNCDDYGYIDIEKFLSVPEKTKVCDCGFTHIIEPAVYRIPTKEETKAARSFLTQEEKYLPLSKVCDYYDSIETEGVKHETMEDLD